MSLSAKPISMISIIYYLRMIILFIMGFMISPAEAQAVECDSDSYDCCWVIQAWKKMGQSTSASPSDPTDCCKSKSGIPGVNCDEDKVTILKWDDKGLKTAIAPAIWKLKNLKTLWLHKNKLTGSLPSEIGNLVNLETLWLNENKLDGTIPPEIGELVNLKKLTLDVNIFTGSIPKEIQYLVNLTDLHLYSNQLTGKIPPEIGKLKKLETLKLNKNLLTREIPPEIGQLKKLKTLWLNDNKLSGKIPPEIGNLTKLTELAINDNNLIGSIPKEIKYLEKLTKLKLNSNSLSGKIPSNIGQLRKLEILNVRDNPNIYGTFTPHCNMTVYISTSYINRLASGTDLTLCGCATKISPAIRLPPKGTPDSCLTSGSTPGLQKRVQAFSAMIGTFSYTCFVVGDDDNANPNQDCMNIMFKKCMAGTDINGCKEAVDQMTRQMSRWWKAVRKECGQWPWNGFTGNKDSPECKKANEELRKNAYYINELGETIYVTPALTESVMPLWAKIK